MPGFIDKVGEIRFTKVKQRQLNKFNNLLNKKEGNITRANSPNLASQAGGQALLPPGEGSNLVAQATQSGRQAGALLPHGEGSNLSQAGSQVVTSQPSAHLPSGEESNLAQVGSQAVTPRAGALLPSWEGSSVSQAGSQAGTLLPLGEGSYLSQAGNQAGTPRQALPLGEGSTIYQAGSYFPGRHSASSGEGSNLSGLSGRLSPSSQGRKQFLAGSQASQVAGRPVTPLSPEEGGSPAASPASLLGETPPKQVSQAVKLPGQAGIQLGKGPSRLPRVTALPPRQTVLVPGIATPPLTPLIGSLKGLPQKTLTLRGSLTYPTNL